jgi:hypothetical protein
MCFMSLDTKIQRKLLLSVKDCIKINDEAIKIHIEYILRTDDTDITGTDEHHNEWINFYIEANKYIKGEPSTWTLERIIEKYKFDANEHLRIINEGTASPIMGDVAWQTKWYWRWLAVVDFLQFDLSKL